VNKRSVLAIVAGIVFVVVVTTIVDVVLHAVEIYPPWDKPIDDAQAALATAYRVVIGVAGAWLTARLAPAKPMTHAMILGAVGVVLATVGLAATWNKGLGPHWYPIALVMLAIPQSWLGGALLTRRQFR